MNLGWLIVHEVVVLLLKIAVFKPMIDEASVLLLPSLQTKVDHPVYLSRS
jgi:hypothetical protein